MYLYVFSVQAIWCVPHGYNGRNASSLNIDIVFLADFQLRFTLVPTPKTTVAYMQGVPDSLCHQDIRFTSRKIEYISQTAHTHRHLGQDLPNHNQNLELLKRQRAEQTGPKGALAGLSVHSICGCRCGPVRMGCCCSRRVGTAETTHQFFLGLWIGTTTRRGKG